MLRDRQFKRKKLILTIFAAIIVLGLAIFFGKKILTENKLSRFDVEIENLNCANPSDITAILKSQNLNYFSFQLDSVEVPLRKKYVCIGKVEHQIFYPDRLKLKVTGRQPKFVVTSINPQIETNPQVILSLEQLNATQSTTEAFPPKVLNKILDSYKSATESAYFLTDESGLVFEEATGSGSLPKLSIFSEELKVGRFVSNDIIKKSAEVLERLKGFDINLDNLLVVGDKLIIDSSPRVTFALNRPVDRQSASLQLILRQAKMNLDPDSRDMRSVESIDLRFDRPVVVYSSKK